MPIADVAELADAQVSEACDGDIVEVQVLSSAPYFIYSGLVVNKARFLFVNILEPMLVYGVFQTVVSRSATSVSSESLNEKVCRG